MAKGRSFHVLRAFLLLYYFWYLIGSLFRCTCFLWSSVLLCGDHYCLEFNFWCYHRYICWSKKREADARRSVKEYLLHMRFVLIFYNAKGGGSCGDGGIFYFLVEPFLWKIISHFELKYSIGGLQVWNFFSHYLEKPMSRVNQHWRNISVKVSMKLSCQQYFFNWKNLRNCEYGLVMKILSVLPCDRPTNKFHLWIWRSEL